MPELPEVQTTVNGLRETILGHRIVDAWSDYDSLYFKGSEHIKDRAYFARLRRDIMGREIVSIGRRAKNILISLSGGFTLLVHMKMTGHLLYGRYDFMAGNTKDPWTPIEPEALKDPFNRHVHFMLSFDNGRSLALSDVRKFAKVALIKTAALDAIELRDQSEHVRGIGPEPLEKSFTFGRFRERLGLRPRAKVKQALMDQSLIAGIGNIYADEALWRAGIHPLERVEDISTLKSKALYAAITKTLSRGISFGGDSTSDYRNVYGEKGRFHEQHYAYQRTGERCQKRGCSGTIRRIVIGSRSAHFCDRHQRLSRQMQKTAGNTKK